ncbi:MAG: hypothetical protein EOM52_07770 [Clostridia bacterium]|nr:hypothetical protein [Clostridia bacterium]
MRHKDVILPTAAVLAGLIGLGLRRWELTTAFEPETGLAIPGMPATWAMIGLSVLVVAAMALLGRGRHNDFSGYDQAFSAKGNTVYMTLMVMSALLMLGSCVTGLLALPAAYEEAAIQQVQHGGASPAFTVFPRLLLAGLAAASAWCLVKVGRNNYRDEAGGKFSAYLLIPAYTACLWLVVAYQARSGDPVILDYIWELFAIIAAVLGTYFMAGFAFEHAKVQRSSVTALCGIYFILLTLGDGHSLSALLLYAAFLLYLLSSVTILLFNANRPMLERMRSEQREFHTEDLIREDNHDE